MLFIKYLCYDSLILQFEAVAIKMLVNGYLIEPFWYLLFSYVLALAFLMLGIRGVTSLIFILFRPHHSFLVCL